MKRWIRASKYANEASNIERKIQGAAQALVDIIDSEDDEELAEAKKGLGRFADKLSRSESIQAAFQILNYLQKEYEEAVSKDTAYPAVEKDIVDYLKSQGYPMTKLDSIEDAYVIVPADQAEFKDLRKVCQDLQDKFGVKYATGLSGSWTAHRTQLNGVPFTVGFEPDLDFDPSGQESSLQLIF